MAGRDGDGGEENSRNCPGEVDRGGTPGEESGSARAFLLQPPDPSFRATGLQL